MRADEEALEAGVSAPAERRAANDTCCIGHYTHADTAAQVVSFFPGATVDDLPDGEGWAIERVRITTHNGTHLDAPYHYSSIMDGRARAITIDEVPPSGACSRR